MYEVEVKVRADLGAVRRRLRDTDADRRGAVHQTDVYYDAPHRAFGRTDEALRLRREREDGGSTVRLAYKGPRVDDRSKTRREAETAVADGEAAETILEALGFEAAATVVKDRERYALDGYTVVLDDVEGVGEFVEVERHVPVPDDASDAREGTDPVDEAVAGARAVLERLGLDADAQVRRSYLALRLDDN